MKYYLDLNGGPRRTELLPADTRAKPWQAGQEILHCRILARRQLAGETTARAFPQGQPGDAVSLIIFFA